MTIDPQPCLLVAEDEWLVAMLLEDVLRQAGYRVLLVARLSSGLALAASAAIDAAILDINLSGEDSFPLADELHRRGIPFLFASGYGAERLPERFGDRIVLQKPYDLASIQAALVALLAA